MQHLITPKFESAFKNYPLGSQESESNPMVIVKLFDACGSITWYLTAYDPEDKIAFGYVTEAIEDEWGYVPVSELEEIRHPFFPGMPRIECDRNFRKKKFSEVIS